MIAWAVILIAVTAVPPLTDAQRAQLDTAVDDSARLDEAALYPLLENVLTWERVDTSGGDESGGYESGADESGGDESGGDDEAGAVVPDYDALLADPAADRGELFLIEGRFAGRARRYGLMRKGGWGDALTEWVLVVRDEPQEVAVVYFVDPAGVIEAPGTGSRVRVVGRFYKVWADRDQDGKPARYLTFIARSPSTESVAAADPTGPVVWFLPVMILGLVVVYVFVRRAGRTSSGDERQARRGAGSADDAMLEDVAPARTDEPLPDDPAEALRRMAEQQRDP
jgi:hypothetical protein